MQLNIVIDHLFYPSFFNLRFSSPESLSFQKNRLVAFDRYGSIGTVMHYILVISIPDQTLWHLYLKKVITFSCKK